MPTSGTPNSKPPWKAGEKAYRASGARSSVQRQRAKFLSFFVPWVPSWRMRLWLYRLIGINITGQGNYIGRECYLDTEYPELITLEPGSKLSPRVIIFCHSSNSDLLRPVKLGADCWVGARCDYRSRRHCRRGRNSGGRRGGIRQRPSRRDSHRFAGPRRRQG